MTLCQGFVVLSSKDGDAPACPAVGSVSKDEPGDDGGWALGAAWARNGSIWIDRPYVVGVPEPAWLAARCDAALDAGASWCQVLNESNLDLEGWVGGPAEYFAFEDAVRAASRYPGRLLAMPPSPGVPGWEAWVRSAGEHACHAYGTFDQMRATVEWYLANTTGRIVITEMNFGAGNRVELEQWAGAELIPFLDWCNAQPRVAVALYFAFRWDQSSTLPTSVDAAGTVIEDVIASWVPPMNGGAGDIALSVPTTVAMAAPSNYQPGPRAATMGVVIHTTRGGASSLAAEYSATVDWFANPAARVSAHLVVGPEEVARCVHDEDIAYHARSANQAFLGIEIAQPQVSTPVTDFQYRAAAEACRLWAERYGFPLERVMTCRQRGLIGHEDSEPGKADGKTDPGATPAGVFDWERFLGLCRETTPTSDPIVAVRDQVWALAEQAEQLGHVWYGQSLKSATALSKGEM